MVDLRNLKLLGKTECECGHKFTANDIESLFKNNDNQFYGGRVQYYSKVECKECHKEQYILLEPYMNSYRVVDIGTEETTSEVQEIPEENSGNEEIQEENAQIYQCNKCGKICKSKSGLISHMKYCV